MYTRQATAVLDSLRSITGDDESAQALQAFANCNTSLAHRGSVTLSSQRFPNLGGVMRPQGNGGGVSGVSRGGPAGGPGQVLRGGVWSPDATQIAPPWGVDGGIGSGMAYPAANFYGGSYYGADAQGVDFAYGQPSTMYMTQLPGGGDYYDNSSYYGAGDTYNQFQEGDVFIDMSSTGGNYTSNWNTVTNNSFFNFPGPTITNNATYNYGGDTFVVNGDTIINNRYGVPGVPGRGGMGEGRAGADGRPGDPGGVGPAGPPGNNGAPGRDGVLVEIGVPLPNGPGVGVAAGGGQQAFQFKELRYISGVKVKARKRNLRFITSVTFDPDTCEISAGTGTVSVLENVEIEPEFSLRIVAAP